MAEQSEFAVKVVRIDYLHEHTNADSLSIVHVWGGYPVVVRTEDWAVGDLAVYVPVDALVPVDQPEFAFLKKDATKPYHRVKAARLRGIFSQGLLVPARPGMKENQDVAELLGIKKWVHPRELALEARQFRQSKARRKAIEWPTYGLDAFRKYSYILLPDQEVVITEKIHGCNARFCYKNGRLYVGSHRSFRGCTRHRLMEWLNRQRLKLKRLLGKPGRTSILEEHGDVWWDIAEKYGLKEKLAAHPNLVFYGEIYGPGIQDLTYGVTEPTIRFFDVYDLNAKKYLEYDEARNLVGSLELVSVPELYRGPWSLAGPWLVDGTSQLTTAQIREGVVIKAIPETYDARVGRVALKFVSEAYLLRKEAA